MFQINASEIAKAEITVASPGRGRFSTAWCPPHRYGRGSL